MTKLNHSLILVVLLLAGLSGTSTLAHEVEIHVLGKGSDEFQLPAAIGNAFFAELENLTDYVETEITTQLDDIDRSGVRLRQLDYVNVEPNLYFTLSATSSGFDAVGHAFGFDASAEFSCPYFSILLGCLGIDVDIHVGTLWADGSVDYFLGTADLDVEPFGVDVDIDVATTIPGAVLELAAFLAGFRDDDLEPIAESFIIDQALRFEWEDTFVGVNDILTQVPQSTLDFFGFNPYELLRNPLAGLLVDVSLIAPTNSQSNGLVRVIISHGRVSPSASVVMSGGVEKPRVSWTAIPGATRYHVYKQSSHASQWQYRGSTTATYWTDYQYNPAPNTFLEAGTPGGAQWLKYYVVAENSLNILSQDSSTVRFAIIQLGGGGGGSVVW